MRQKKYRKRIAMISVVSLFFTGMSVSAAETSVADPYRTGENTPASVSMAEPEIWIDSDVRKLGAQDGELSIAENRFTTSYEWDIIKMVNKLRIANGSAPLSMNDPMIQAARVRASELYTLFSHTRPNGTDCWTALTEQNVSYGDAGENIAMGYLTPVEVMNGWMGSEGHRKNILQPSFAHIGIGYQLMYVNSMPRASWTQLFLNKSCNPKLVDLGSDLSAGATAYYVGTPIDNMPLVLVAQCEAHGQCMLPVVSEMCSGLDVNRLGEQELLIRYNGYGARVNITMHPFSDLGHAWYTDWVVESWKRNTMTGLTSSIFAPEQTLVRAQFAQILYKMENSPEIAYEAMFPDVSETDWFAKPVLWANSKGIVTGYTNTGTFGPTDAINREQMAVMMYRYAKGKGLNVTERANLNTYYDAANVSAYAEEAMKWAVGTGIITGKDNGTKLDPAGYASRAECATIVTRFQQYYE